MWGSRSLTRAPPLPPHPQSGACVLGRRQQDVERSRERAKGQGKVVKHNQFTPDPNPRWRRPTKRSFPPPALLGALPTSGGEGGEAGPRSCWNPPCRPRASTSSCSAGPASACLPRGLGLPWRPLRGALGQVGPIGTALDTRHVWGPSWKAARYLLTEASRRRSQPPPSWPEPRAGPLRRDLGVAWCSLPRAARATPPRAVD